MTLDQLVREYTLELGSSTVHQHLRFLQYGIATLRDLHLDVTGLPKFVTITVNANGTADLPLDFISELSVSICDTDGNRHRLGRNRNMCVADKDDCGDILPNTGSGETGVSFSNDSDHYKNGEFLGRHFGLGGGQNSNGYYDIKETEGYIMLQNFSGSAILLEYLADLERNSNGEYEVAPYIEEVVKAGMFWRSVRRNSQKSGQEKQMAYSDYRMEKDKAHRRIQSVTLDEIKSSLRKNFTPTPKH